MPPIIFIFSFPSCPKFLNFSYVPSTRHIGGSCLKKPLGKETVLSRGTILAMELCMWVVHMVFRGIKPLHGPFPWGVALAVLVTDWSSRIYPQIHSVAHHILPWACSWCQTESKVLGRREWVANGFNMVGWKQLIWSPPSAPPWNADLHLQFVTFMSKACLEPEVQAARTWPGPRTGSFVASNRSL